MTDETEELSSHGGESGRASKVYSRRELVGLVVMLWLAGSLSDLQLFQLVYGLQGYGWFGYGGYSPSEYRDERTSSR